MTELRFEYDQGSLRRIENKLGLLKSEAPKALKDALNKTAKDARKDLGAKAQQVYTVKTGAINSQMRIRNASTGNLVAIIKVRGAPTEMKKFSYRGGKGSAKLATTINRNRGTKTWDRGFRRKSGNLIFAREGEKRLPIKKMFSLSVPSMIGNPRDVYNVVEPNIQSNLDKNVNEQIRKILAR